MSALALRSPNPADLGFPPTLPVEIALRQYPISHVCASYGITESEWNTLRLDPRFRAAVDAARKSLERDGMSFKMKARLQAEELLKESWRLVHAPSDEVPANVKADLIKATWRVAGYDPKDNPANNSNNVGFSIQINLG